MKRLLILTAVGLVLAPSCKKAGTPQNPSSTSAPAPGVPLGPAAGLVPSAIEEPAESRVEGPTVLALPTTTATLSDRHKVRLVVVLELDAPETKKEAEGRIHEFQDFIILILADRASNDLLNSFARDDLRYAIYDAIRNSLPPRGLKKVYFTDFVIE